MASAYEETAPKEFVISDSPSLYTSLPVSHENEGYAYQFVDETLSSKYECSFCLHVVRAPVLIPCGDIACSACWQRYASEKELKNEEVTCPLCRHLVSAEPVVKTKRVEREVKSLKVYCENKYQGCCDSFELRDIEKHHQVCGYQTVSCRLSCGESVILKNLKTHERKKCLKRLDRCYTCDMTMTVLELKTHDEVCLKKMIPCNLCEMKVSRDDLEAHQKETCLLYETNCAFSLTGCRKKILRSQLDSHQTNHYNYHLNSLNRGFLSLSESLGALAYIREQSDAGKSTELPGHLVQYAALAEKTEQTGILTEVPSLSMECVSQMENMAEKNEQEHLIPDKDIGLTANISASVCNDINTAATVGVLDKIKSLENLVCSQRETIIRLEETIIRQEETFIRQEETISRQEETINKWTTKIDLIDELQGVVNAQTAKIQALEDTCKQASVIETKEETKSKFIESISGLHEIYESGAFTWQVDLSVIDNWIDSVYFYSTFRLKCSLRLWTVFTAFTLRLYYCKGDYDDTIKFPIDCPVITGSIKDASTGEVLMELQNEESKDIKLTRILTRITPYFRTIDEWDMNSSVNNYIYHKKPIVIDFYF